jgi:ABC-2 type transport system permease protein
MKSILLVAARDFRQVVATRGFKVTLLIVPVSLAISIFVSIMFGPQTTSAFSLVDATGQYKPLIERSLESGYQRESLRSLANYVDRWKLASVDPGAPWARRGAWVSEAEVARFVAEGGAPAALKKLQSHIPSDASPFKTPKRLYIEVPPPAGAPVDRGPDAFGGGLSGALQGDVATSDGKRPLVLAVYIPKDFGQPGSVVRMWTNGRPDEGLIGQIREVLTSSLRFQALQASGLSAEAAGRLQAMSAPVQVSEPPAGGGRGRVITRSVVPLVLVYLLLITGMTTGSMMLQGLVEERSNKLIESVLACIHPADLMYGKLLGLGGVGLCIITVWSGCALGAAFLAPGVVADLLRPSLAALDNPWIVAAMLFYFLSGYLVMSMLFLAIGSLSDSMQDAQSYLAPVMMLLMLPVIMVMQATLRSPDSALVQVMSWIPLYTPFSMLARLGTGVPLPEMLGTGAVLIAFIALELLLLGRLFRASLLSAGQPTRAELFARMMLKSADR